MAKIAIVGGGLFGCMAAHLAVRAGHSAVIYDDRILTRRPAGSVPAACLIKPGWISGLGEEGAVGLEVLDSLFGLTEIEFELLPLGRAKVFWVPPNKILTPPCEVRDAQVLSVGDDGTVWLARTRNPPKRYDAVLVAAGVWCDALVDLHAPVKRQAGIAFLAQHSLSKPFIKVWAPYKQIVAFDRGLPDFTWVGDGSSILEANWDAKRSAQCLERCANSLGEKRLELYQPLYGLRPYVTGHPKGYYAQVRPKVWVSTGGAKNGTVIAAYQARRFVEDLR